MNERVTPGLCSYYFSARFKKNCPGHFRFFILRPSNLGLFRLCLQPVARKKIYSEN